MPVGHDEVWVIAQVLLERVHAETRLPMIICDAGGTIVKAVDRKRIGTKHAGAQRILAGEVAEIAVTADEAAENPLVREGYSCPIVVEGARIGTFGVTGPLGLTKPVARIAAMVLATWIVEAQRKRTVSETAAAVVGTVQSLSARLESMAKASAAEVASLSGAAQRAAERLGTTDEVVASVHQLAIQSHILALNGSIEAARAGDQGAAFAVVAQALLGLAKDAGTAADQIRRSLAEVRAAVKEASAAAERSARVAKAEAQTMREVERAFETVRETLEGLDRTAGGSDEAQRAAARGR
jgi:sugar diacid utilization regulator